MRPKVFIIHGRDLDALSEMAKFLTALGLDHLPFEEVAARGPAPFIADVVIAGIEQASAVIALFTPDEQAALYDPRTSAYLGREGEARWQARPNVLFEAGVALGVARNRTILVTLGADVGLFSDLSGVHVVRLDTPTGKRLLYQRLQRLLAHETLNASALDSPDSGDFQGVLRHRWPHYDELASLEAHLRDQKLGRSSYSLHTVLTTAVVDLSSSERRRLSPRQLIKIIEARFTPTIADYAYWWLVVYGVFRFEGIERWTHGDEWTGSVDNAMISERGHAFLHKLAITSNGLTTLTS